MLSLINSSNQTTAQISCQNWPIVTNLPCVQFTADANPRPPLSHKVLLPFDGHRPKSHLRIQLSLLCPYKTKEAQNGLDSPSNIFTGTRLYPSEATSSVLLSQHRLLRLSITAVSHRPCLSAHDPQGTSSEFTASSERRWPLRSPSKCHPHMRSRRRGVEGEEAEDGPLSIVMATQRATGRFPHAPQREAVTHRPCCDCGRNFQRFDSQFASEPQRSSSSSGDIFGNSPRKLDRWWTKVRGPFEMKLLFVRALWFEFNPKN